MVIFTIVIVHPWCSVVVVLITLQFDCLTGFGQLFTVAGDTMSTTMTNTFIYIIIIIIIILSRAAESVLRLS